MFVLFLLLTTNTDTTVTAATKTATTVITTTANVGEKRNIIIIWCAACVRGCFEQIWMACVCLWMLTQEIGGRLSITWEGLWSHTACLRALAHIVLQIMSLVMNFSPCFHLSQSSLQPCYLHFVPPVFTRSQYHASLDPLVAVSVSVALLKTMNMITFKSNMRDVATYFISITEGSAKELWIYPGYIILY